MNRAYNKILAVLIIPILTSVSGFGNCALLAQCSDAGVCSIGDNAQEDENGGIRFDLSYGFAVGSGEEEVTFHNLRLQSAYSLTRYTDFTVRWDAFRQQNGPGGDVSGIGDLYLLLHHTIWKQDSDFLRAHAGAKLATGDDNADADLPQIYQNGLGTNDLLFGLSYRTGNWSLLGGYQLTENTFNENSVTPLKRGDDVYIELSYAVTLSSWRLQPELMVIKRLQKSELRDPGGATYTVPDSDQLQVNLGTAVSYPLSRKIRFTGHFAFPLFQRDVNVDGLTRSLSLSAGSSILF